MYTLQFCDYDEEKEKKEKQQKKDTLPVFYRVLPSVRANRVIKTYPPRFLSMLFLGNHAEKC